MDVSGSPDLFVNRLAREIAPIRVTGNYGSEILRSVRSFKPNPPNGKIFHPDFRPHVREAVKSYEDAIKGHRLSFMVFKQMPWHHYGRLALEQSQLTQRSPFLDYELVRNVYQAPPETTREDEISLRLIADGNPRLRKYMTDRGVGGDSNFFFSMIARSCLEFTFKAEYAYDYGMPQWIAKIDHLISCLRSERLFLGRHKFSHFRVWYRDQLSDYIKDILLDKKTMNRSYLNAPFIENIVRNHLKGNFNFTTEIHKVLTSELIERSLLEGYHA
jgi:asparagine synthase (glutamine-hydrolysing)